MVWHASAQAWVQFVTECKKKNVECGLLPPEEIILKPFDIK